MPETVAGHRWVSEVYQPVIDAIPPDLAERLAPEVVHGILEHRWFLSERAGRDVGTTESAWSYVATVLSQTETDMTMPST